METLGGLPNLPALWLRRAKPACANAIERAMHAHDGLGCRLASVVMETLGGLPNLPAKDSGGQSPPASTRRRRPEQLHTPATVTHPSPCAPSDSPWGPRQGPRLEPRKRCLERLWSVIAELLGQVVLGQHVVPGVRSKALIGATDAILAMLSCPAGIAAIRWHLAGDNHAPFRVANLVGIRAVRVGGTGVDASS